MSDSTMIKNGGTAMGRRGAGVLRNRTLMRLPITLYRAGLGFLFGPRMLMLEHVGRKSGARRFVALEVVARPRPGSYVVPSGFGERSQWFRNVIAEPRVRVSTGFLRSRPATARRLTTAEADEVLAEYIRRHPKAWRAFSEILPNTLGEPLRLRDTNLPMIELRLD